jgi:hypothetical protein
MVEIIVAVIAFLGGFLGGPLGHIGVCAQPSIDAYGFQAAIPIRAGLNPTSCAVNG